MKTALFLIIGLLILPSFARADDFTLSGYAEGKDIITYARILNTSCA